MLLLSDCVCVMSTADQVCFVCENVQVRLSIFFLVFKTSNNVGKSIEIECIISFIS